MSHLINQRKSLIITSRFLEMIVNSENVIISLSPEKFCSIKLMFKLQSTIFGIKKSFGLFGWTILAILLVKLDYRFLQQQQQTQVIKKSNSYYSRTLLSKVSQMKLLWWINDIEIFNERVLVQAPAQVLLRKRYFFNRLGCSVGRTSK